MKLKLALSLPKLVKLRVGVQLGLDVGARLDVRLKLRGGEPLRWKAAIVRGGGGGARAELPEAATLLVPGHEIPRA
ncbi:MAG TPA: hypothetical protein VN947_05795 [Polyangia bacterium]|nr:hypothetical protein [Polyangia bacterium]